MRRSIAVLLLTLTLGLGAACGSSKSSDTNASGSTTTAKASGGNSGLSASALADLCTQQAKFASAQTSTSLTGADYQKILDALDQLSKSAPTEIRADVSLLATSYKPFFQAIIAANGDFQKAAQSADFQKAAGAAQSAQVQAAGKRVTDYFTSRCHA